MSEQKQIVVLHGPNLNLLGAREPEIYGTTTLNDINQQLCAVAEKKGVQILAHQHNHEGDLIEAVHWAIPHSIGLIINPGGYTHTSVALADAVAAYPHPVMEVHLSNIYAREAFRHHSYISAHAVGVICGLGADGYRVALEALIERLG